MRRLDIREPCLSCKCGCIGAVLNWVKLAQGSELVVVISILLICPDRPLGTFCSAQISAWLKPMANLNNKEPSQVKWQMILIVASLVTGKHWLCRYLDIFEFLVSPVRSVFISMAARVKMYWFIFCFILLWRKTTISEENYENLRLWHELLFCDSPLFFCYWLVLLIDLVIIFLFMIQLHEIQDIEKKAIGTVLSTVQYSEVILQNEFMNFAASWLIFEKIYCNPSGIIRFFKDTSR